MPTRERALVVEDDPIMRTMLASCFAGEGYEAEAASTIAEARQILRSRPADFLLLDIVLPDGDGIEFARELRRKSTVGIIFVTNRKRDADRILGLEAAGDDYVTKPVNLRELMARVRALCRRLALERKTWPDETVLEFDPWLIDLRQRELSIRGGQGVRLTRGEFDLLAALVLARGAVVTRDYLAEVVSKREIEVMPRTVDVLVSRIRGKLEKAAGRPCPILTVVGHGYRLDAAVASAR